FFLYLFFFFFQAEDGIRDKLVTGVQTCALPISSPSRKGGDCCARRTRSRCWCSASKRPASRRSPPTGPKSRAGSPRRARAREARRPPPGTARRSRTVGRGARGRALARLGDGRARLGGKPARRQRVSHDP